MRPRNTVFMQISKPDKRDMVIYAHLAPEYHAWVSPARGIAMLRVDKLSYPRKHTSGN